MDVNLEKALKEIIANLARKELSPDEINSKTNLIEDLGFDSILLVELVVAIEEQFHIELDDENLLPEILGDVGRLTSCVANLCRGAQHEQ